LKGYVNYEQKKKPDKKASDQAETFKKGKKAKGRCQKQIKGIKPPGKPWSRSSLLSIETCLRRGGIYPVVSALARERKQVFSPLARLIIK